MFRKDRSTLVLVFYLYRVWQWGDFSFQLSFGFFSGAGDLNKSVSTVFNGVTFPFYQRQKYFVFIRENNNLSANRISRTSKRINVYFVKYF